MLRRRIEDRVGGVDELGVATLIGYRLCFNKKSSGGSGKANIMKDEQSHVLGVIYKLSDNQFRMLDEKEKRYHREALEFEISNNVVRADTYVADIDVIEEGLRPTAEYRQYLIDGAREHGFPSDYVESLEKVALFPK